ncbi:MAG: lamin tail domain-containing protein [bacterium]
MLRFFAKKWAFVLIFVLLAICLVVFVWNIFENPPGKILSNFKFFQAALVAQQDFLAETQEPDYLDSQVPAEIKPEQEEPVFGDLEQEEEPTYKTPHEAVQDQLDDIAEKLDIISQQISDLSNLTDNVDSEILLPEPEQSEESEAEAEVEIEEEAQPELPIIKSEPKIAVSGGKPNYLKILISEVQVAGKDDEKQEFVELYNPNNNQDIELTGWYLQKKTAGSSNWSTYASKNLFSGKTIFANGYFLIARTEYYLASADIFTDGSITADNSFALKNPNGEISDKLGFGLAQEPELLPAPNPSAGQSVGRIVLDDGSEWETDNNFNDFELQTPTPRMKNITYVAPEVLPEDSLTPVLENILINEIQVEGESVNDDWVELYNPNDISVSLNGWSIQRASSTGKIYRVKNFDNEATILGKSYFLIVRSTAREELLNLADMTCSGLELSSEMGSGNTIYVVKKQEILEDGNDPDIVDKVGFGLAKDYKVLPALKPSKGKSTGRIWDEEFEEYKNTSDNSADFEIQTPTPKAQNIIFVEPPNPELVSIEITTLPDKLIYNIGDELDIFGLVVTGNYDIGNPQIITITLADVAGFDSTSSVTGQDLTIMIEGQTAIYTIDVNEITDTAAPQVTFNLDATQNNLVFTINFEISDPLDVVTPSGLDSYIFHWREEGGDWQEDELQKIVQAPSSDNFEREFGGNLPVGEGITYYFQVNAVDIAGNWSGWIPDPAAETKIEVSAPVEVKPIIINEIQIEGETVKDDWVELYNPNEFDIFLHNYNGSYIRLVKRAKTSTNDTTIKSWSADPDAKILAGGYYLWASSANDGYPASIGADAHTKQNIADDNGIALRVGAENTGEIIDAVGWGLFDNVLFETSPTLNPGSGQSITRTAGVDTDDNSLDFIISDAPSPGGE